jgi:hypothetical protein
MNPLRGLRDWCRRPGKIKLSESREPIVVGVPYKRGVIVVGMLLLIAIFSRIYPIDTNNALVFGGLYSASFALIAWLFEFFSPGHVKASEDNWRARDPKGWKAATDQATCPECGSDEVVFDTLELYNFPVEARCKRCGHKWWYTPPYASYRVL